MGEDKNGDVTQEVVLKGVKDWRVTGGGVGQFCSSLWSLQLKLPSHLGQFISIFTLGFVKIPTQNCGEGFYEARWWNWHHVLLIMIQWKWATSCTWWWDAKTHTRLYSFLIQIMQQWDKSDLLFDAKVWTPTSYLMQPELQLDAIPILARELFCRASNCHRLFPQT